MQQNFSLWGKFWKISRKKEKRYSLSISPLQPTTAGKIILETSEEAQSFVVCIFAQTTSKKLKVGQRNLRCNYIITRFVNSS